MGHVIFVEIFYCFTFVSCLIDNRLMVASPLFCAGHSFHVDPIDVEMYRLTFTRIVIEF